MMGSYVVLITSGLQTLMAQIVSVSDQNIHGPVSVVVVHVLLCFSFENADVF